MEAQPKRLRDGSWGAVVQGLVEPGDEIRVKTQKGKEWDSEVDEVLYQGPSRYSDGMITIVRTMRR